MSKKINLFIIITCIIISSLWSLLSFIDSYKKTKVITDVKLFEITKEINKNLPKMVDLETRADSTIALSNKTIQYNFTLLNYLIEEVNSEELKSQFYPIILNNIKTNNDMRLLKDNNITIIYLFSDKNGCDLFKLVYDHNDYK